MAEKIYVLDTHTRFDGQARPTAPSRRETPARRDVPVRERASSKHAELPRHDELFGHHAVSRHDDEADAGASDLRPDWSRVPQMGEEMPEAWVKSSTASGRRPFHPLRAIASLYTLGGVAPFALRVGPRQFAWAALSIVSLTAWVTLAWFWSPVRAMMTSARLPILPFMVGLVIVQAVGAYAWSRAMTRTVRDERFQPERLPRIFHHPWVAAIFGMLLPGSGLAVAGCATRAGLAIWNASQVSFAILVLANAGLLWTWNTKEGVDALPKSFVEGLLVACAGIVAAGGLLWVGGALDGVRVQLRRSRHARPRRRFLDGDSVALALVMTLVACVVVLRPASTAHDFDAFATSMRFSGYRLIPLGLESAAMVMDPGRPEFAMRVAELHTEMGHVAQAQAIHDRLRTRWEAYAQMLLQSASTPSPVATASPKPIQPAGDLVPRSPALAPSLTASVGSTPPASPAQ